MENVGREDARTGLLELEATSARPKYLVTGWFLAGLGAATLLVSAAIFSDYEPVYCEGCSSGAPSILAIPLVGVGALVAGVTLLGVGYATEIAEAPGPSHGMPAYLGSP